MSLLIQISMKFKRRHADEESANTTDNEGPQIGSLLALKHFDLGDVDRRGSRRDRS